MPDLTLKTMLILDHEQYNMVYEGNFEENFAHKMNLMYTSHIIYVLSFFFILNIIMNEIYIYINLQYNLNLLLHIVNY